MVQEASLGSLVEYLCQLALPLVEYVYSEPYLLPKPTTLPITGGVCLSTADITGGVIGAIGALMNRVLQPRPLVVLGLNVWMGTAAGADELLGELARLGDLHLAQKNPHLQENALPWDPTVGLCLGT